MADLNYSKHSMEELFFNALNNGLNGMDVFIQDQTTELVDLYACNLNGTTNPTTAMSVDDYTVTVDDTTGAVVGDCINIREDDRYFQSIISDTTDNIITFKSPCDYTFTTDAIVCFGEWDLSTADGSNNDKISIIVQDNLTDLSKVAVTIHGHKVSE